MNTPSDYDRVIFQLAMLSNQAAGSPGISDEELRQKIADQLTGPLARWEIAWGPHVVQNPANGKAINTMYVAKEQDQDNYVVAMAGTNPYSIFDWLWEDLFVEVQVPWVYAPLTGAKIAVGTATGLVILQNMEPDEGAVASGTSLWDFLKGLTGSPISVTVTGHSLGGALSPTVALWLRDTQGIPLCWDPDNNATVTTMPFAGPTAGNGEFAAHSNDKLPHGTLPSSTPASFRYANSLDIVPHAWNEDTLSALKALYVPDIPENKILDGLVDLAMAAAANGDYTQLAPPKPPWTSTVNTSVIKPVQPPFEEIQDLFNYLRQAVYQHVQAYYEHFALAAPPLPAQIPVPPIVRQLVEKAGGTLPSDMAASSDLTIRPMTELVTGAAEIDEQSRIDKLVAEMKKYGAEQ